MNFCNSIYKKPDGQYQNLLRKTLKRGLYGPSQQGVNCYTLFGASPLVFNLEKSFPMITERKISGFWEQSVGEIFAFINGVRTLKGLEEFGCHFWTLWGTKEKCKKRGLETGDLGPGSYGGAFHDFPTQDGGAFNQFKHIIEQIRELPHLRSHFISPWIPQYAVRGTGKQQQVVVVPCHGWISIRIIGKKLILTMVQRSADIVVGVPSNMVQYAALTMAIARVTGYTAHKFVHTIIDAHVYENQIHAANQILMRKPRPFPTVRFAEDAPTDDLLLYRSNHFVLNDDYYPHPAIQNIPVAI